MNYIKQNFSEGQVLKASHLNHIEEGLEQMGASLVEIKQSDWNQTDETQLDFIKNKPSIPDAIINPSTASVGQTLVVKSVDENGKPTEWETIDIPNEVPDNPTANQQLVTDSEGNVKWEDRTHYSYSELAVILPETTISGKKSAVLNQYSQFSQNLVSDHEYTIVYNGTEYKCKTQYSDILCTNVLGNMSLASLGSDTGEPFFFNAVYNSEMTFVYFNAEGDHVISINDGEVENVSRLDTKYLPTTVPVIQSAQVGQTVMVKVVDENGKPTEWETSSILSELEARGYIKVIQFMDGTSFGMPLQCNMTPEEIISSITGDGVLAVYRRLYLDDRDLVDVYTCNIGSVIAANGSNRARKIDFNDGSAPIIVDASNNTITLDPDWTAPEEVALKSDVEVLQNSEANQQLVTDAEGNVKWEDKTHYENGLITAKLNSNDGFDSGEGYEYGRYVADSSNVTNPDTKTALCAMGDDIWAYLNEVWADSSKRRRLVFYWDGVRVEPPAPVFRLPYIYNGLNDNLPYIEIFREGSMAKVCVRYHEAGEHTFSYEARNYQLKQLDEDFIPDTIARKTDIENLDYISYNEQELTEEQQIQARTNIGLVEETSDDALELLAEMGVLEATTNEEGFVLTDENNNILTI